MTSIPPARFEEFVAPDAIAYEVPGQPYEIEIQPLPDGVRVVVPRAGDRAVSEMALWVIPVHVLIGVAACGVIFSLPRRTISSHFLMVVLVPLACVASIQVLAVNLIRRWRGGQPAVVVVARDRLWINHPARLLRRRTWPRGAVIDVSVDRRKGEGGAVEEQFVRITRKGGRSVTFCHGRDTVELARVVSALREVLALPPMPGEGPGSEARPS
jgi:hypothetical protein